MHLLSLSTVVQVEDMLSTVVQVEDTLSMVSSTSSGYGSQQREQGEEHLPALLTPHTAPPTCSPPPHRVCPQTPGGGGAATPP